MERKRQSTFNRNYFTPISYSRTFFWRADTDPETGASITHIVDGQQRLTTLIILLKLIAIFLEKSGGELEKAEEDKLNELIVKDNPVEYASYVEFGHRQQPGRYVPALGKQLKQGWVKGRFMLTISEGEIQDIAPKVIEAKLKKWLKNGLS